MLRDMTGKEMPAIKVFSEAIKYLKNHLLKELENRDEEKDISEDCIGWVLTVPAIWTDAAKQFMREAAEMVYNLEFCTDNYNMIYFKVSSNQKN